MSRLVGRDSTGKGETDVSCLASPDEGLGQGFSGGSLSYGILPRGEWINSPGHQPKPHSSLLRPVVKLPILTRGSSSEDPVTAYISPSRLDSTCDTRVRVVSTQHDKKPLTSRSRDRVDRPMPRRSIAEQRMQNVLHP
jgi:hypothetical protein